MTSLLLLAFVFLLAGVVAVPLASRLGLGSVLGYLLAGIAIGPLMSLWHVDMVQIQHIAEFGVVIMLFLVGLELEPATLWAMRGRLLGLGGGQVVLTALLVTGAGVALGLAWQMALAIGLVLSLSSTAIVLQTLNEKGLLRTGGGQSAFAVLLFQDIAVIPMLALLPLLAVTTGGAGDGPSAAATALPEADAHGSALSLVDGLAPWQSVLVTLGAIAVVVLVGSYLTRPLFRTIASTGLRELFTAAALMLVVGIALLMSLVGLSPALGTFIAGVVLANSEYRHELESDIEPFRGLLLGLFFMSVGAGIDFALLRDELVSVLAMTLGLMALKGLVLYALATMARLRGRNAWLFSLSLAQAGEFGFVLLALTVARDVIPQSLADRLLLVVALSMLLTPLLFILFDRVIAPRYREHTERDADVIEEKGEVIIAGVGRFGGIVNRILKGAGYSTTVVDVSASQLDLVRAFGVRAWFGDATRPDLLEAAGIREAKLLVVAIDNRQQINTLVRHVLRHHPHVHVVARAVDRSHVFELYDIGCRDIVRETFDSSVRAARSGLEALGVSEAESHRIADGFVADDRTVMIMTATHFDPDIPMAENTAFVARAREIRDFHDRLLLEEGTEGFGRLALRLKERGEDPDEVVARFESETRGT